MATLATLTVDVVTRTGRFRQGLRTMLGGLTALGAVAGLAFKEFEDAEKIQKQTAAVLKSTGGAAGVTARDVKGLSNRLMELTGIDDDAISGAQNLLLTFTNIRNEVGKGNKIFDRATSSVVDMSVALGQDFKSSAIQVGKALNDPVKGLTALRRVGVSFTDQQADMVKRWVEQGDTLKAQKFILDELTKEFGGSAEAQKTASGTMLTALGELAETAGGLLAPVITEVLRSVTQFAGFLQEHLGPALSDIGEWFRRVWERVKPVVTVIGRELWEAITQTWDVIQERLWPALKRLFDALKPVFEIVGLVVGAVLKLALEALPVVVSALAWFIDNILVPVFNAFGDIWNVIKSVARFLKDKFVAAWQAIKEPVMGVINPIVAAVEALIDGIKTAIQWLKDLARTFDLSTVFGTGGPHNRPGGVPVPGFRAHGGPVSAGQAYVVGERGPELFVPAASGTIVPNAGGVTINVHGDVNDAAIFERKVVAAITRAARRSA